MEHLIKQYFRFLGERLHQKKIFPNFLTEVHFFYPNNNTVFTVFSGHIKKPTG